MGSLLDFTLGVVRRARVYLVLARGMSRCFAQQLQVELTFETDLKFLHQRIDPYTHPRQHDNQILICIPPYPLPIVLFRKVRLFDNYVLLR